MSSSKKRTLGDVYRPDVGYQAQPPQQPQPEPPGQKSQRAQKRKQKKSKSSSNTPAHSQGGSYADDEHARRMERAGRFKDDGALAAGAKKNTAKRDDHRRKMLDKVRVFETGPDSAGADDTIDSHRRLTHTRTRTTAAYSITEQPTAHNRLGQVCDRWNVQVLGKGVLPTHFSPRPIDREARAGPSQGPRAPRGPHRAGGCQLLLLAGSVQGHAAGTFRSSFVRRSSFVIRSGDGCDTPTS